MSNSVDWPDNPFWDFSLKFYGQEGVAERLITLQENLDADVNIMLYCCWAAYLGAPGLTETEITYVVSPVKRWQKEIVTPLRTLRSKLKIDTSGGPYPWSDNIRMKIKIAELEAERLEQLMIYQAQSVEGRAQIETWEKRSYAKSNLFYYLNSHCREPDSEEKKIIDYLIVQLFP